MFVVEEISILFYFPLIAIVNNLSTRKFNFQFKKLLLIIEKAIISACRNSVHVQLYKCTQLIIYLYMSRKCKLFWEHFVKKKKSNKSRICKTKSFLKFKLNTNFRDKEKLLRFLLVQTAFSIANICAIPFSKYFIREKFLQKLFCLIIICNFSDNCKQIYIQLQLYSLYQNLLRFRPLGMRSRWLNLHLFNYSLELTRTRKMSAQFSPLSHEILLLIFKKKKIKPDPDPDPDPILQSAKYATDT